MHVKAGVKKKHHFSRAIYVIFEVRYLSRTGTIRLG